MMPAGAWLYHPPQPLKPDTSCRRPCGCYWDVIVFGHAPRPGQGCGGRNG